MSEPCTNCELLRKECDALKIRQGELLATIVRVTNETPFADEAKDALAQRGILLAEIGTLRSKCEHLETVLELLR